MNEKIKQLLAQAFLAADDQDQAYEKFAELIVRRVISVYNDSETFKTSTYDDNRVLEYFGIEE